MMGRAPLWRLVKGPAAACYMTAYRLGWKVVDAHTFITDEGQVLELMRDSPAFVKKEVARAVSRWRNRRLEARHSALCSEDGAAGAHLDPILRILDGSTAGTTWTPELKGAL
eukprot:7127082-Karenia_brevis.AAC.1